ncbi:hypothetical protein FDJ70_07360 [Clostridium botulinum]|uniref:Uncharacterized protein n=1 Tax=Clostridium botulinum TaxID=1491 RepID=A0A6G4D9J8_CLOBO|nr:hypothetical protein [Clostridium botulinum]NFU59496.1 hypothetical protein [Clostridium botulinum]NFV47490.1 hypothetical protein [Clostridium botulinum]
MMNKFNKEDFMGKRKLEIKAKVLKQVGNVEVYELNEYNMLSFCNFMTRFLENNKETLEKGQVSYNLDDRIEILNMFTNINLENFKKTEIIEILMSPSEDVINVEEELLNIIIPQLIEKTSDEGIDNLVNMDIEEQRELIEQVKEESNENIDTEQALEELKREKERQLKLKRKEELERQIRELELGDE